MTRIDTTTLTQRATNFANRTEFVCRDPAVIKVAKVAVTDCAQAASSIAKAVIETRSSWLRASDLYR